MYMTSVYKVRRNFCFIYISHVEDKLSVGDRFLEVEE